MAAKKVYGSRSIKPRRVRRTQAQLQAILAVSRKIIAEENGRITIMHLFYRLVGLKSLEKTEREYSNLDRYLMKWRRSKEIPWSAFADNSRFYYGTTTHSSMEAALKNTRDHYRRDLWATQNAFVEIWTEKDSMASILMEEARTFGVRVFPFKGFTSGTSLYNAADAFKEQMKAGKTVYIYYFGDHDPSTAGLI